MIVSGACPSPASSRAAVSPGEFAARLADHDTALRQAIDGWHAEAGRPPAGQAPQTVVTRALYRQRRVRFLARHPNFAAKATRRLPPRLAGEIRLLTVAQRKLFALSGGGRPPKLRTGRPQSLARLVGHYRKAQRRYRIGRHYLAAINLVETKFGRVKSTSSAGAKGPMQFIPSTWRIYGNGGDIHDPHDSIQAAARLLRDNGAPRDYKRALYAYNPSKLYVAAVRRFARVIARRRYAIHHLYCWGP